MIYRKYQKITVLVAIERLKNVIYVHIEHQFVNMF